MPSPEKPRSRSPHRTKPEPKQKIDQTIWLEKYRPKKLEDIVGNEDFIQQFKIIRDDPSRLTNFMLCGPPGVGKTTCIHALANEILGVEVAREAVLELNASDERGIDVVRDTIHSFARAKFNFGSGSGRGNSESGIGSSSSSITAPQSNINTTGKSKIVILDEVDSMTTAAQQCLRVIMEEYAQHTKFALACNISSKVIEAVQSRCAILRFSKVKDEQVEERLRKICAIEKVPYQEDGIKALSFIASGDMRIAVNGLQSSISGYGSCTKEHVYKVCDAPNPYILNQVIQCVTKSRPDLAVNRLNSLLNKGYAAEHVLSVLSRCVKTFQLPEHVRLEYLRLMADTNMNCVLGCASKIQMDALLTRMSMVRMGPN